MTGIFRWTLIALALLLSCGAYHAQPDGQIPAGQGQFHSTLSASEVVSALRLGQPLDYDNVTITGPVDLRGLADPVAQPLKITNSRFLGPVNLEGATFNEPVDLRGSVFQGNVSFAKVRFQDDAKFAGARFLGQTDYANAVFMGLASFMSTRFFNDTSFGNVQFDGDAIFMQSGFAKDVDYNFAQFARLASFELAYFNNVSFLETQFGGHTSFRAVRFAGNATFAATNFQSDVVFRGATFDRGSTFGLSAFRGLADFGNVVFRETAYFGGVKFSDLAYFVNAMFNRGLILEDSRLYSMQLDNATFGKDALINLNGADFTKFVVRWDAIKDRMVYNGAAYLALVKNYKNLEWFDDADNCYYQYRRIGQDQAPWGWSKISDIVSWISCGYGVRVSYTAVCCLLTILLFGVIFWAGKGMNKFEIEGMELPGNPTMRPSQRVSLTDALYFSIAMFTTSQAPVNTYPVGVYRHLAMLEGIMGWFFLGLFVVVLSAVLIR